jgi:hypothetical protein
VFFGADEDGLAADRGGGHDAFVVELVLGEFFEFAAGGEDGGEAAFAEEVDFSVARDGGGGEVAGDAFGPEFLAGFGFEAGGDALVVDDVEQVVDEDGGGFVGGVFGELPDDVLRREDAAALGVDSRGR